jgi:hypothetical protein
MAVRLNVTLLNDVPMSQSMGKNWILRLNFIPSEGFCFQMRIEAFDFKQRRISQGALGSA